MPISITADILSSNRLYTDNYLKNTINLTKSIVIKNDKEARLYNEYIGQVFPTHKVDTTDRTTWRYYKHLSGQHHPVDTPMELISVDNGTVILLTLDTIALNKNTHKELLQFSYYYQELVNKYPDQELLIRSIIATTPKRTPRQIIDLEDYTIVGYNSQLVESNEDEIIYKLQERINNYKVTQLLHQYTITDSLFLASQYHILYSYIVTTLLSLRLENAKTPRAHSYHILNYLSSHHYLDVPYRHLSKRQALYLYRNLLFLNTHSGGNLVQESLIENLFNERNISVVNYRYEQTNQLNPDGSMKYFFKQKLMNKKDLVYSKSNYRLEDLSDREITQAKGNKSTYECEKESVNNKLLYSLSNKLLTKDLETIITDVTDTVKYKLITTIIDYWAYLVKIKSINFLVSVTDPVNNITVQLLTEDLFKLYTLLLYKANNLELTHFPNYQIDRVFKPILPETDELLKTYYKPHYYHKDLINEIKSAIPIYTNITTAFQFSEFVSDIYKLNIGLWLLESNLHDKDDNGQTDNTIKNLHQTDTLVLSGETPEDFLRRVGIGDLYEYPIDVIESMTYNILDSLFDNKLDFLNKFKSIQKALVTVFKKFASYTTQMLDDYSHESSILAGIKDTRVTIDENILIYGFIQQIAPLTVDMEYRLRDTEIVRFDPTIHHSSSYYSLIHIPIVPTEKVTFRKKNNVFVNITPRPVYIQLSDSWVATPSTREHLNFLAFNPLD